MDQPENVRQIFDSCARQYQEKFMDLQYYREPLDFLCSFLEENDRIFDIGCGPGNVSRYLLQKKPGLRILGIDLSPKMIELAKVNNPTASFQVMDCRKIDRLDQSFDAVVCGFCLPYLSPEEVEDLILKIAGILKNSGLCYLSTMVAENYRQQWVESSQGGSMKLLTHFHESELLLHTMRKNGFRLTKSDLIDPPAEENRNWKDLVMVSRLQKDLQ
ncbi:class I SAM-dependent DNA methyltransferase [Salinimicrobium flavum]|uniref:Class I SAM-dependent DNA methyltransferase n=1 Tax=Salinimicrobium flavum TaxID=1737065 RepID=A0ABW5J0D4_9FLAO